MKNFISLFLFLLTFCSVQAQNFKYGKVSKEEVLEKAHPLEKDANAAVLYREHRVRYEADQNTGFTQITEVHERIKIYNKDGFAWATEEISLYKNDSSRENVTNIKGVTYNIIDGKLEEEKLRKNGIFEEETNKYWDKTTLTMPAVTEGSVIEYSYTIRSPFITSIDEIYLQYTIPTNNLEVEVSIPEFFGFRKHFNLKSAITFPIEETRKTFSFMVTETIKSQGRIQTRKMVSDKVEFQMNNYYIKKNDIPALKEEAFIDYLYNYAASMEWELQFTKFPNSIVENYAQTWEGVTKSIFNDGGYEAELGKTNYFEDDVDAVLTGITAPEEKAVAIFRLVKNKVKWNGLLGFLPDEGPRSAYKDGEGNVGDINIMLIAMLKYAGLKAHPVMLSSRSNGIPIFPTRTGFNYVIAAVEFPGQFLFLDATDPYAAAGELPERARNWQGRLITDKNTSTWVDIMPHEKSRLRSVLNLKFAADNTLEGKSSSVYNGLYAKNYRDSYLGVNEESYLQDLEEGKGNISILNLEISHQESIGSDVEQNYDFQLKDELEEINGRVYLRPMLFEAVEENPFKADTRKFPIFFDFPSTMHKTVNIMVPEGYEVESLPESLIVELNAGAGSFKYLVHQNGNFLRVESVLDISNIVYSPADFTALKEFYSKMVDKHTEAIVFKKS